MVAVMLLKKLFCDFQYAYSWATEIIPPHTADPLFTHILLDPGRVKKGTLMCHNYCKFSRCFVDFYIEPPKVEEKKIC